MSICEIFSDLSDGCKNISLCEPTKRNENKLLNDVLFLEMPECIQGKSLTLARIVLFK
jgi:hypothetical protein